MTYYSDKLIDTSGDLIIKEAQRRGIQVRRFPEADPDTVLLEYHDHHEPLYYSRTNRQGSVAVKIADNKALASAVLRHAGFPVPVEIVTADAAAAQAFLAEHGRVVVKPLGNTGGIGVTPEIASVEQLERAITRAKTASLIDNERELVVIQKHIVGQDYRLLVIDQQRLFAINRIPAQVVGDGIHTVTQLIDEANKIRKANTYLRLSDTAQELLIEQGLTDTSVPSQGQVVRLERVANYHAGGNLHDVTDKLHPSVQATARAVATYFNLGIIGVDCISPNIAETIGAIIEINATPAITIHHFPDQGQPRNAAAAIIDMLFPETVSPA